MTSVLREGEVATILLDDGGMNLLGSAGLRSLHRAVDEAADARMVVVRSGRKGLFAAGADMREMRELGPGEARELSRFGQQLMSKIASGQSLTVVIVDGDCFGGALDLVMSFDLRVGTTRSRFSHPGGRLGIVTGFGGTSRWREIVDPAAVSDLFLRNEVLSAEDALRSGLLTHVTDAPDELLDRARDTWLERWPRFGPWVRSGGVEISSGRAPDGSH